MRGLLITVTDSPISDHPNDVAWDPDRHYRLDPAVALRPEPFGALAYHYDSRRLTFLRDLLLVEVVKELDGYPSARQAVEALVPDGRQASFLKALANLAGSKFIQADPAPANPTEDPDADR